MPHNKSIPATTRVTPAELAKARDGLLLKGLVKEELNTKSQILRAAIFLAIFQNNNPESIPSEESLSLLI